MNEFNKKRAEDIWEIICKSSDCTMSRENFIALYISSQQYPYFSEPINTENELCYLELEKLGFVKHELRVGLINNKWISYTYQITPEWMKYIENMKKIEKQILIQQRIEQEMSAIDKFNIKLGKYWPLVWLVWWILGWLLSIISILMALLR